MEKSIEMYDSISIYDHIAEGVEKKFPINLEYYKIYNGTEGKEKPYGIGIIKKKQDEIETNIEQREFSNIFSQEKEADKMLKMLVENEVTPISLGYILEDLVIV